jgi:extracellular factor (EF) 3-hydroxypalmitic acid methyl ester biosynthesis protein
MKSYEELVGSRGRTVFYRPERYRARDVFKGVAPTLALERVNHTLDDISLSGLGAFLIAGSNEICAVGEAVSVELDVMGVPLFEGKGRVARVDPTPFGAKIGLRLENQCFDIPRLVAKSEEVLVARTLDENVMAEGCVSPEYRRLCADVVHLLRRYRAALDRIALTQRSTQDAGEILASCEERILPQWRSLWQSANELVRPIMVDQFTLHATKRFTEMVLTPEFMPGAIWRRSYKKPLGYPGDFEIMNMVYDWRREGERPFDQLLHRVGLDVAECIATRMVIMRESIARTVSNSATGSTARIASLGCGSAREVTDYLKLGALPGSVNFTLIDQDESALSGIYELTYPGVTRLRGQANVNCLHASFSDLLKTGELFGKLPPQDLIYSVGLIDYLSPRRAKALVTSLYTQLARGGTLVVANMFRNDKSNLWPMEFICDWSVNYRDDGEMRALAGELPNDLVETFLDPTGRVCLLTARKN